MMLSVLAWMIWVVGCGPSSSGGGGGDGDGGNNDGDGGNDEVDAYIPPPCPNGTDEDGDGFGDGCPAGPDCNDGNDLIHPDADEICNGVDDNCNGETDEGVLNACGSCSLDCNVFDLGNDPFPMPDDPDPNADADGVGLNPDGDLILDQSNVDFNYMWIANTNDLGGIGTVSKIDTDQVVEVARYFTTTCFGNPSYQNGLCESVPNPNVPAAVQQSANAPSRTAVDFNFDVWVANRAFGGQPSATKIANSEYDCVDRNGNGVIDTSWDVDGDGHINTDCNGDGQPDSFGVVCSNGGEPEFLGWDDECVLMTVNYANNNEYGRSVCLDGGDQYGGTAGNAWVGTNNRGGNNRFFKIDGDTGEIQETVDLPAGHEPYGCAVDSQGVLWAVSQGGGHQGRLVYFDTADPQNNMGQLLEPGYGSDQFYGVTVDSEDNIWCGGWGTDDVYRYAPDRASFSSLHQGVWTRIRTHENGSVAHTRGIAADLRDYIWVASNNGCIVRIPQTLGNGDHPGSVATLYGPDPNGACNLGGTLIGVGVDFAGNVWGISHGASIATRLDVDQNGNPTGVWYDLTVGANPYTYSDFTGYGLRNFTRPRGTYKYIVPGCGPDTETTWVSVEWNSTEPPGTRIEVRFRTGDDATTWFEWYGAWDTSPADLSGPPPGGTDALAPNPAPYGQVEFQLISDNLDDTPVLHDFVVIWECQGTGPG
jgi:hypothetical protein